MTTETAWGHKEDAPRPKIGDERESEKNMEHAEMGIEYLFEHLSKIREKPEITGVDLLRIQELRAAIAEKKKEYDRMEKEFLNAVIAIAQEITKEREEERRREKETA